MRLGKAALLIAAGLTPSLARADTETPVERERADRQADYAPIGFELAGLRAFPRLEVGFGRTSNIFRTATNEVDGEFYTASPAVTLQSDWSRHELKLSASADIYRYDRLTSEDRTDWHLGAEGRIDVTRPFRLLAAAAYDVRHEERGAPDAPGNAASPTRYRESTASGEADYRSGHLGVQGTLAWVRYDWDDTALIGLPSRSNADRDRTDIIGDLKASYEFSPGYEVFLRYVALSRDYDLAVDRDFVNRGLSENTVQAGVTLEMTTLLVGEIFGGYSDFRFKDAAFKDLSTFDFGASLRWYPTELMTIRLSATRTLEPTTLLGVSGVLTTAYTVKVEHELLRNLQLVASASYAGEDFEGSTRDDHIFAGRFEAHYSLNRTMAVELFGAVTRRNSTLPSAAYNDTAFGVRTAFKL